MKGKELKVYHIREVVKRFENQSQSPYLLRLDGFDYTLKPSDGAFIMEIKTDTTPVKLRVRRSPGNPSHLEILEVLK